MPAAPHRTIVSDMPRRPRHTPCADATPPCACAVCAGAPRVLVAIRHPTMCRYTAELLARECGCWAATETGGSEMLTDALLRVHPDLLVVDDGDFPACCRTALESFPPERVVVVGREPDPSYRSAALHEGAGAWVARDRMADDLVPAMRAALGCRHDAIGTSVEIAPADLTGVDR